MQETNRGDDSARRDVRKAANLRESISPRFAANRLRWKERAIVLHASKELEWSSPAVTPFFQEYARKYLFFGT